jgi:hypothetical protein
MFNRHDLVQKLFCCSLNVLLFKRSFDLWSSVRTQKFVMGNCGTVVGNQNTTQNVNRVFNS